MCTYVLSLLFTILKYTAVSHVLAKRRGIGLPTVDTDLPPLTKSCIFCQEISQ